MPSLNAFSTLSRSLTLGIFHFQNNSGNFFQARFKAKPKLFNNCLGKNLLILVFSKGKSTHAVALFPVVNSVKHFLLVIYAIF